VIPEVALMIGFALGVIVTYIPLRLTIGRLHDRIHWLIKERNIETLNKYMQKLEGMQ